MGGFVQQPYKIVGEEGVGCGTNTNIAGIASQFGVQPRTVWRIVKYYTDEMMRDIDLSSLRIVSLDETSCNKGRKYVSHFIDHDCGAVVFCTEGNDGTVLSAFGFWLIHHNCDPEAIRVFCCDMSRAYISGIRMFFPKAAICFDPFHVIQHANVTLDSIHRKSRIKGKAGKGLRFGDLMNKEDLESKDEEYKERIVETLHSYR